MKKHCLLVCSLLLICCNKKGIYEPVNPLPPRLAVVGHLDMQTGISVRVSKAVTGGDTVLFSTLRVTQASVILTADDGQLWSVPHRGKGIYTLDSAVIKPLAGKKYRLTVRNVPNFEEVNSMWVAMPLAPAQVGAITFNTLRPGANPNFKYGEGLIEFTDRIETRDHYLIQLNGSVAAYPTRGFMGNIAITTVQPCEFAIYGSTAFKDGCLRGTSEGRLVLKGELRLNIPEISDKSLSPDSIHISFGTVSDGYFDYLSGFNQPTSWEKGFAEPRPSYTNIEDGIGVFYATNTQTKTIKL